MSAPLDQFLQVATAGGVIFDEENFHPEQGRIAMVSIRSNPSRCAQLSNWFGPRGAR
jgi:hypothetical protein